MANKNIVLTHAGLDKIEKELEHLKVVKRKEIAERIKEARSFGDLSENSEYDEAKNAQAEVESRIEKLEYILKYAEVVDEEHIETDTVSVGSKVTVFDKEFDEEVIYTIVGATEADPYNNMISNESPVGGALIGRSVGEIVDVEVPSGVISYKILNIAR